VLTMHTTGDGLVVPENEQAYRSAVTRARKASLLRQVYVHRAGHCAFTPAETVTAGQNNAAAALGPGLNIFTSGGKIVPTAPAFISYRPARYLRPFNLFPRFSN